MNTVTGFFFSEDINLYFTLFLTYCLNILFPQIITSQQNKSRKNKSIFFWCATLFVIFKNFYIRLLVTLISHCISTPL